jgi:cellulose synthase/poly-beta-1,6-N-acetylglucosamine synthase-like glycosyltransferase
MAKIIFWISLAAPVYAYVGYPLVLLALRLVLRRPVSKRPIHPFVSLLIAAHNEAVVIERKIENSLALDYPQDRLEIVIASDGSRDATADIARRLSDGTRVRVLAFPENRGKMATLNASVPQLRGEVVVFSDATAMLERDSLARLLENFADPVVGAVSGRYKTAGAAGVNIGRPEDLYWRYESFLKTQESQLASTVGGHGHLHAIRKELYSYPPAGTINDDCVIPLSVLAKGYRAVYAPNAVVCEEAREMAGFGRRIRIMAGNIQQMRHATSLLRPLRALPLFFLLSHKASRLVAPFALLAAFIVNAFLLGAPLYIGLFCGQAIFYLLAILGIVCTLRPRTLMLPFYFSMINAAAFFGFYHALTNRRSMAWK